MNDLISRQAAMKELGKFRKRPTTSTEKQIAIDYCVGILQNLPSAEKRGRWMECDHGMWDGGTSAYRCSECGKGYHTVHRGFTMESWNYCPNCGARMEESK